MDDIDLFSHLLDYQNTDEFKQELCEREILLKIRRISRIYLGEISPPSIYSQSRKSRDKSLLSTFTNKEWIHCRNYFDNRCAYCGIQNTDLHQDHFISSSERGPYTRYNIVPACPKCNHSKYNHPPSIWIVNTFGVEKSLFIIENIFRYLQSI